MNTIDYNFITGHKVSRAYIRVQVLLVSSSGLCSSRLLGLGRSLLGLLCLFFALLLTTLQLTGLSISTLYKTDLKHIPLGNHLPSNGVLVCSGLLCSHRASIVG